MIAFAANSVLNRLALSDGAIGPASFALIRLVAGAVMLGALVIWQDRRAASAGTGRAGGAMRLPLFAFLRARAAGATTLAIYVLGFSFAYRVLDAGLGALMLFGGVQLTMFAGAVILGEHVPPRRWIGAALASGGLAWLLWPAGAAAPALVPTIMMLLAAVGWGLYSLIGRRAGDPLRATAGSFALAMPFGIAAFTLAPLEPVGARGIILAVISGAVTSGLGYALWYAILPALGATRAAVAQLTVPLIAMAGGMAFLAEPLTTRFVIAAALVMAGVALSLTPLRRRRG